MTALQWKPFCITLTLVVLTQSLYASEPGYLLLDSGNDSPVGSVDVSSNEELVASCDSAGGVFIWSTKDWKQIHAFSVKPAWANSVRFSADSQRVAVATSDGDTFVWDLKSKKKTLAIKQKESQGLVRWLDSDELLATASDEYDLRAEVRLWRSDNGRHVVDLDSKTIARDVKFLPQNQQVITTNIARTIDVFDAATGKTIRRLGKCSEGPKALCVSHDEKQFVVLTPFTVELWDMKTRRQIEVIDSEELEPESDANPYFTAMAWLSEKHWLAIGRENGILTLLDRERQHSVEIEMPASFIFEMDFAKSGKFLAVCGWENRDRDGKSFLAIVNVKQALKKAKPTRKN